ncbi:hypothetical protein BJ322DRAFT_135524 [Thelephora terrestris]|uniref:Uncharacterized protein n=1 Tax=Thelephora terrestris TaxID=56493 RepID=A0A9P6HB16_9AGAM|nr:hypothetical protein BJ322DRAFT_135524 [Thelephora terrestris]
MPNPLQRCSPSFSSRGRSTSHTRPGMGTLTLLTGFQGHTSPYTSFLTVILTSLLAPPFGTSTTQYLICSPGHLIIRTRLRSASFRIPRCALVKTKIRMDTTRTPRIIAWSLPEIVWLSPDLGRCDASSPPATSNCVTLPPSSDRAGSFTWVALDPPDCCGLASWFPRGADRYHVGRCGNFRSRAGLLGGFLVAIFDHMSPLLFTPHASYWQGRYKAENSVSVVTDRVTEYRNSPGCNEGKWGKLVEKSPLRR